MNLICIHCGKKLAMDATSCKYCGKKIDLEASNEINKSKLLIRRRNNVRVITNILIGIFLTLSIVLTFVSYLTNEVVSNLLVFFAYFSFVLLFTSIIIKHVKLHNLENNKKSNKKTPN